MFSVQKWNGGFETVQEFKKLSNAIEWCEQHDNKRPGRIINNTGKTVWTDRVTFEYQDVCDQFGYVGRQLK